MRNAGDTIFPIISQWALSVSMETRVLIQSVLKVIKNGTSCSSLGTQTYGVELGLVDPVSG